MNSPEFQRNLNSWEFSDKGRYQPQVLSQHGCDGPEFRAAGKHPLNQLRLQSGPKKTEPERDDFRVAYLIDLWLEICLPERQGIRDLTKRHFSRLPANSQGPGSLPTVVWPISAVRFAGWLFQMRDGLNPPNLLPADSVDSFQPLQLSGTPGIMHSETRILSATCKTGVHSMLQFLLSSRRIPDDADEEGAQSG